MKVLRLSLVLAALLALSGMARSQTVYVDANLATGTGDGSSWADAYQGALGLQVAVTASQSGQYIYVADGTYRAAAPAGARTASFGLKSGVRLFGGFAGGELTPFDRPPAGSAKSILSGDLNGDDLAGGQNRGDNSYHVINAMAADSSALVSGFFVEAGQADGAGIDGFGGGLVVVSAAAPVFEDCVFRTNQAATGGACAISDAGPRFTRCSYEQNQANVGGGVYLRETDAHFDRCTFRANAGLGGGGGLHLDGFELPSITSSLFVDNTNISGGAGILIAGSGALIDGCTFVRNVSSNGPAGGLRGFGFALTLVNSIFWENQGPMGVQGTFSQMNTPGSRSYLIVQNLNVQAGSTIRTVDPLFVDFDNDDFRLQPGSPAIDSSRQFVPPSIAAADLRGGRRHVDDPATPDIGAGVGPFSDLGAYEFPAGALGTVTCEPNSNSSGATGAVDAFGSASVSVNSFTLTATGLPLNQFGIFIVSRTLGFTAGPGGSEGNLCLGGAIGRIQGPGQIVNSGSTGTFTITLNLSTVPTPMGSTAVQVGESWSFQAWHRDTGATGATSNYTDATTVVFE